MTNNEELIAAINAGHEPSFLYFWGHTAPANVVTKACFSQWYLADFRIKRVSYRSTEHFMMEQKAMLFGDHEIARAARTAATCADAKALGRQVRDFDDEVWARERMRIVVQGNLAKFSQNRRLSEFLLSTGDQVLVEASPVDTVWGIGLSESAAREVGPNGWKGLNLLGYALMQVREQLRDPAGTACSDPVD